MTGEYRGTPARLAPSRRSERNPKRLQSGLPRHLSRELFARAEVVELPAGRVLFWAGDSGDGCYRVEDGLLKLAMGRSLGARRTFSSRAVRRPVAAALWLIQRANANNDYICTESHRGKHEP
jgi:CRP-like cAMP-binding protein